MGRSYLFGVAIGGLCSVLGLGVLSLMAPLSATSRAMAENGAAAGGAESAAMAGGDASGDAGDGGATGAADEAPAEIVAGARPETVAPETVASETVASEVVPEAVAPEAEPEAAAPEAEPEAAAGTVVAEAPTVPAAAPAPETAAAASAEAVAGGAEPVPDTPVVEVPPGSEFARARPEADMVVLAAEDAPPAAEVPAVAMPEAEPAPELAEVKPAAMPQGQSEAPGGIAAPEAAEPLVLAEAPSAVGSVPLGDVGRPPALAAQDSVEAAALPDSTAPEAPAVSDMPAAAEEIATADPAAPGGAALPPAKTPDTRMAVPEPADMPATDTPEAPGTAEAGAGAGPEETREPETPVRIGRGAEVTPNRRLPQIEAPAGRPDDAAETGTEEAGQADSGPGSGNGGGPAVLDLSPAPPIGAASAPQPGFAQRTGVRINRLPRIGDDAPASGADAAAPVEPPSAATREPAAMRFAARFDNPSGQPFLSIVIADIGEESGGLTPAGLAAFGTPVTIAIDPQRRDAAQRAAIYRLAGHEVAILAPDLPDGATASDLEVAYQGYGSELPEAVALIGTPEAAFQHDRRVAQHLAALLASDGRGLVSYDRGLNPARQAALGEGVATASVYRALDAGGEGAAAIARYLDRAAFEAARQGDVVVVATSRPGTVAALQAWIAAGAKGMRVAPVSAAMAAEG